MVKGMFRVKAVCDELDDADLTLDVWLVDDRIVDRKPIYGVYGKYPTDFSPVILTADGDLDFGSALEGTRERLYPCTLRSKIVRVGEAFSTIQYYDGLAHPTEFVYRIKELNAFR